MEAKQPREVGRMQCGCTVEATEIEGKDVFSVQQCPLHKAAPEMLQALIAARVAVCHIYGHKNREPIFKRLDLLIEGIEKENAALPKARGEA